jgi:hypothetical protein
VVGHAVDSAVHPYWFIRKYRYGTLISFDANVADSPQE